MRKEFKVIQKWANGKQSNIASVVYAQDAAALMATARVIKWEDGHHSLIVWSEKDILNKSTGLYNSPHEEIDAMVELMFARINAQKARDIIAYMENGTLDAATGEKWLRNLGM